MAVECLQGDLRTVEGKFCRQWIEAADDMRNHLFTEGGGFDPLRYNETATVGFLVAAAGRAGLFAMPEFLEDSARLPEGRVRAGRCDLWLAPADWTFDWVLEFKLFWYGPDARAGLITAMNKAVDCAFGRSRSEASDRWAATVYCPNSRWFARRADHAAWTSPARIERLCGEVDLAFLLGGPAAPAYLLLKRIARGARPRDRQRLRATIFDD